MGDSRHGRSNKPRDPVGELSGEFRSQLLKHDAEGRLLGRVLDAARSAGLLKERGRQRTDSTHVLGALRVLNRLELVGETLRAALNAVATVEPDWLRAYAARIAIGSFIGHLRVEGAKVVLMPSIPCANTNVPTIMMSEKIADAIRWEERDGA